MIDRDAALAFRSCRKLSMTPAGLCKRGKPIGSQYDESADSPPVLSLKGSGETFRPLRDR